MPIPYEDARRLAMELSCDERSKLSEELWWSLHPPAENLPQEEIDSGAVKTVSIEETMAELDAQIAAKRL